MSDVSQNIANLSPDEKRALLAKMLAQKASLPKTAPTSFAQARMWLLQQLNPDSVALNLPLTLRMTGTLDQAALQRSLNEIARRHATLRTALVAVEGQPTQLITPHLGVPLQIIDLRDLAEPNRAAKTESVLDEATLRVFDLTQAPLIRALLIQTADTTSILHLVLHHTICDGWSMTVLARELSALYGAFVSGQPSPLPELAVQYADFCRWQHQVWQDDELADQLAYWRKQLHGSPPVLELPIDHPRPAVQTFRGARVSGTLSADLVKPLKALSQQEGATLFMTLLAAFQTLLARLSGQEDIPVGSPIVGRARAEVEGLIGVFINNLVLRTDLSGNPTFRELLKRVRAVSLDAYAHQDLPFEKIVEDLQPERSLGHTPLFQVVFNMLSFGLAQVDLPGLDVEFSITPKTGANFDVMLYCVERDNKLELLWEYDADLFEAATIERWMGHWQRLLEAVVVDPNQPIADLPIMSEVEREQLVHAWNDTALAYPAETIQSLFKDQVRRTPEAVAVMEDHQSLTYRALNARANQLAHYLRGLGVTHETPVAICLLRSIDLLVGLLGILKAGGAYVPLDPAYPQERLAFMLDDSGAPLLLTHSDLAPRFPEHQVRTVCLDVEATAISQQVVDNLDVPVSPEALAYLIYTSGSTGTPKGVQGVQRGAINRFNWMWQTYPFGRDEVCCQKTYLSFVDSVWEIFGPLLQGVPIVMLPDDVLKDHRRLIQSLADFNITRLVLVPSLLRVLLTEDDLQQRLPRLRYWISSGEALPLDLAQRFWQVMPNATLINLYGSSEVAADSTYYEVRPFSLGTSVPIGRPIANTQVYLLDAQRRPVPIGVPGEITIGGDGLARGYHGRPDLTNERFIPNPFGTGRLYRTGDLGRYLPDGNIEYVGRLDHQVKIRGFRVELGEIEAALTQHAQIRQSVVMAREDRPGDRRLVAYIVLASTQPLTARDLRHFLQAKLPDYMVPSAYVFLEVLPLTPSGKVDRRALPVPDAASLEPDDTLVAPRTPIEELLVDIWLRVMGRTQISVQANFFEMGGHSLMASQVIARVRQVFNVELPLRSLFESPTVAGLAGQIEAALQGERLLQSQALMPVAHDQPLPLSFSQERMWLLQQLTPDSTVLNLPFTLRLRGQLDRTALQHSLSEIVWRHATLRTAFVTSAGRPAQLILPDLRLPLQIVDLRESTEADRESTALAAVTAATQRPFDLTQAPLMRALLIQTGDTDFVLHLVLHHAICDGWSITVLARELSVLYAAFVSNQPSPLPPLPIQYVDFCRWQRDQMSGVVLQEQLAYWRTQLQSSPPLLELPTDYPRPAIQTFHGERVPGLLSADLVESLRALSRQEGATPFMILLAAFQVLLARLSGQDDIPVGAPIAGRMRPGVEGLIGIFINNLVLRTDLAGNPTFRELIGRVRAVALDAYAHQEVPFEKVVEDLQPQRSLRHTPLFQVMFNMLSFGLAHLDLPGLDVELSVAPEIGANFDMTLYCVERAGRLELALVYNATLFEHRRMVEVLHQYEGLIHQIVENPDRNIRSLSLVTPTARMLLPDPTEMLAEPDYPSVPTMFADWVVRQPSHPAVRHGGREWTYAELAVDARALVGSLQAQGIRPGQVVGVTGPRSYEFITAMLAVLMNGDVLLTLDRKLPAARQQLMLETSKCQCVVYIGEPRAQDAWLWTSTVNVIRWPADRAAESAGPIVVPSVLPDDPAYIFFTSGTTGVPKGILGRQRGLSHFLTWQRAQFGVGPDDRSAQLTGLSFDVVLRDVFLPLTSGATLCLPDDPDDLSVERILPWLENEHITLLHTVPALAQSWLVRRPDGVTLRALRQVFFAGEPLTGALVAQWRSAFPESGQIANFYGPTETTLAKCYYVVPAGNVEGVQPIGWPLPSTQALVLADRNRLCGIGESGEIVIRTPFRSLGYLNAAPADQQRFAPNPFRSADDRDLIYCTGDRGRYRPDGAIEILGRLDDQVKIRGMRVEPDEVNAALTRHPAVRESIVLARESDHAPHEKLLVAYVVAVGQPAPTARDLRQFLHDQLPDYMVPTAYVLLAAMPLTPNGKVDRRALPMPDAAPLELDSIGDAPRTPIEEALVDIWQHVMGRAQIGIQANFFEMGGHSLMATQIVSRVRQVFKIELPLRSLFETPTVAGLAEQIETALQGERPASAPPLLPVGRDQPLPLSFSQERMWFIHQLQPDSSAYNMGALTRLTGHLNVVALEHGFAEITRRHEDLRTTFATVDGQPVQIVAAAQTWHVNVIDLQGWPAPERESEALRLIRAEARRPFDLQRGPLLRLTLYCLSPDVHLLYTAMHHIVSDAWSMGVLSRELMTLYNASVAGQPVTLPVLEIQYADFAAWQRQRMTGETLAGQVAYWRSRLAGVAVLDLPTDRPRPVIQSQHGAMQSLDLPASLLEGLHRLNQKKGLTLFMTTLAAFQVLVQRYTGQTDVAIGVPIANRHQLAIENLIGTFVNTLVVRTDLAEDPTFNSVLERVRNTALEAFTHQDLSFAQLVAELQPERDTSHSPLFQIMFNVINVPTPVPNLTGLDVAYVEVDRGGAQFDLSCTVIDVPTIQRVNIAYNTDLFDADTIARFIQHYTLLLESIVARPGAHISELPILTEAERRQLLWGWNDTAADYPRDKCVHHLFERQAGQTPDAVAVISQSLRQRMEEHVTYHELNRRANQLAHYLCKLGVKPGVYVGISIERSVEMVVGLLGILKAGGAYVPLDPAFPRERLAFMLQDSQVPVLLTQASLLNELPAHGARAICLDADWETIAQESAENPEGGATPADLAYILYTSGSTGKPKGVQIPHRALTNFLLSMQIEPGLTANDVLVSMTTLSFDIAGLELYLPLITGARVVVVSHEVAADGALLLKALDRYHATVMQATPATWRIMIDSGWISTPDLKMLCGGEALPRDLANQILERGSTLWNMYGPTETTIWSSTYEVRRGDAPIHLGHPIANTQFYILDGRFQPVPIGVPGELYIGGDGVARGYLNRPDLTAERFLNNPFIGSVSADGSEGERIYKTGDLARYRADGTIEFLGRADFQVKVRGFRIELGDIEAALLQHVQVRQAVVVAREDRPGDKRLVAYIIPENDPALTSGELRSFLKERLPDYMVPTLFVSLDKLPLTPNGKVDRRALPKPEAAANEPRVYVAPRTPLEEIVATIWAQVLKIEQVSAHDNFFELGGHSLLATQIVARLRDKLQIELPLSSIFEAPTVAELADRLDAIRWAAQEQSGARQPDADDREEIEL